MRPSRLAFLTKATCFTLRTFQQSNNFSSTQAQKSASFHHGHQTIHTAKVMIFRQPIPQQLDTYGTQSLTNNIGLRRSFPWIFTIADVNHAIICADFLRHFNLLVDLRTHSLIDAVTHLRVNGITSPIPALSPVYAPFPPTPFTKLLGEYPDITRPTTKQTAVKHNVAHHILTRGPPCSSRPRHLPPERLKIAKDEFQHMLDNGIICLSSSSWASPLHMVPKFIFTSVCPRA